MAELDAQALFTRDSKRLDAKARAAYKKLGMDIEDSPGELQMIADNITLDETSRADIFKRLDDDEMGDVRIVADNITFTGGAKPEQPQPQAEVPSPVSQPTTAIEKSTHTSPIVVALATAGLLGTGVGLPVAYYLGAQHDPPAAVAPVDTDTNTRGVLELVPEDGQRPKE